MVIAGREVVKSLSVLEDLFATVPDIVFFAKDVNGCYTSLNRTLVERCGCRRADELLGRTAADVFPGDLGRTYLEQDLELIKSGRRISERLELHLYPSGVRGWCLTTKVALRDADGSIVGLAGISRDLHEPRESSLGAIAPALEYINNNYGEHLNVTQLARMCGLSVYQFEERLRRAFQLTAGRYISKIRIDAGCEMLRSDELTLAAIAQACGYSDQSAFSRQFKALTGMTPGAYRKRMRIGVQEA